MRTLYQTLEHLVLELPFGDDISQTTRALFLVYSDEIWYLPWADRQAAHDKLCERSSVQNLIALVVREMQRHARAILVEQGRGEIFEQSGCPVLPPEVAAIVQSAWDALGNAPAWTAFESQIDKLATRYAED